MVVSPEDIRAAPFVTFLSTTDAAEELVAIIVDEPQLLYEFAGIRRNLLCIGSELWHGAPVFVMSATLPVYLQQPLAECILQRPDMHILAGSTAQPFPYEVRPFVFHVWMDSTVWWVGVCVPCLDAWMHDHIPSHHNPHSRMCVATQSQPPPPRSHRWWRWRATC